MFDGPLRRDEAKPGRDPAQIWSWTLVILLLAIAALTIAANLYFPDAFAGERF
jgi:hypothetical protein